MPPLSLARSVAGRAIRSPSWKTTSGQLIAVEPSGVVTVTARAVNTTSCWATLRRQPRRTVDARHDKHEEGSDATVRTREPRQSAGSASSPLRPRPIRRRRSTPRWRCASGSTPSRRARRTISDSADTKDSARDQGGRGEPGRQPRSGSGNEKVNSIAAQAIDRRPPGRSRR